MYWFNWNSDNPSLHPYKQEISSPLSFSFPPSPCIGSPCDSPIHSARSSISIEENEKFVYLGQFGLKWFESFIFAMYERIL